MDPQRCSSEQDDKDSNHRNNFKLIPTHDISDTKVYGRETYDLLERVIIELKHEDKNNTENIHEGNLQKAVRYTGLHRNVLQQLWSAPIKIVNLKNIDRKQILDELFRFYFNLRIIPNSTLLFNSLQNNLPPYVDIKSFRTMLVRMGFIFKKTDFNTAIVIENPAIRYERYMYLKRIIQYRDINKPLYYICEGGVVNGRFLNIDQCRLQKDKIQYYLVYIVSTKIQCLKLSKEEVNFERYVQDALVDLDANGVIIFDNSKSHNEKFCETPTANSLKCDMIEWLQYHQVPFVESMSKFELWLLIEKCTDTNANLNKIDYLIIKHGLDVLRIPDCINNLTPASNIQELKIEKNDSTLMISDHDEGTKKLEHNMNVAVEKVISAINFAITVEESRLLNLEIKVDSIIDNLRPASAPEIDDFLPDLDDDLI